MCIYIYIYIYIYVCVYIYVYIYIYISIAFHFVISRFVRPVSVGSRDSFRRGTRADSSPLAVGRTISTQGATVGNASSIDKVDEDRCYPAVAVYVRLERFSLDVATRRTFQPSFSRTNATAPQRRRRISPIADRPSDGIFNSSCIHRSVA